MATTWTERRRRAHGAAIRNAPVRGECAYCLAPAQTTDHVLPRTRGGGDEPDNLVPACFTCNRSKGQRTPAEWLADGLYGARLSDRERARLAERRAPRQLRWSLA